MWNSAGRDVALPRLIASEAIIALGPGFSPMLDGYGRVFSGVHHLDAAMPRLYASCLTPHTLLLLGYDLGKVGNRGEFPYQRLQQAQAIGAEILIVHHHHDFVEESIHRRT